MTAPEGWNDSTWFHPSPPVERPIVFERSHCDNDCCWSDDCCCDCRWCDCRYSEAVEL